MSEELYPTEYGNNLRDEIATLRKQLEVAVWKIKSASRLLEALRMDSGVGNILSEPMKDLYKSIEQDLQETLKKLEA